MEEEKVDPKEQRKKVIESLESNLKNGFYLNVIGTNDLRRNHSLYGELGEKIGEEQYLKVMGGEDASKLREKIHKEQYDLEMKAREEMGIADMPEVPYSTNYQLTKYIINIVDESVSGLPVGNLEKVLGGMASAIKLEIPEELKAYESQRELIISNAVKAGKSQEEIKAMLDKDSETALGTYRGIIYGSIRNVAAEKVRDAHKYDGINAKAKETADNYRKAKGILEPQKKTA